MVQDKNEGTVTCSCAFYIRNGFLCRHALKVLINDECESIPDEYIMRRWRRDLIPPQWIPARARYGEMDVEKERVMGSGFVYVERIFGRVRNDQALLEKFVDQLRVWDEELDSVLPLKTAADRRKEDIEELIGVSEPDDVSVVGPSGIHNKGCGKGKRLKGVYEKAVEEAKKPKRRCRLCKKMSHHDSRNCPKYKV